MIELPGSSGLTRAQAFMNRVAPKDRLYRSDPVGWAGDVADVALWSKQREIIESVRDNKRTAVKSCHQVGKSFVAALTVCWWLATHPPGSAFVVTTAPTFSQVRSILWREIGALHSRALLPGKCNQTEWSMNGQLVAIGRKPSDHNQHGMSGLHAEYMLAVIDEACGVNKMMFDAISTLVTDANGKQLAIGNPDTSDGEFFKLFRPDSGWHPITISAFDSPNFTEERVPDKVSKSLITRDWQIDRAGYWGEDSALYQSKVLGQFPDVGDPWQVIPIGWANNCRYREFPSGQKPIEAGIDVGAGHDRTVVVIRENNRVVALKWFVNPDPMQSVAAVATFLREHNVSCAKIDVIGIGWGIYGRLKELSAVNNPTSTMATHMADVIPINVAESPTLGNEHRFMNKRAEMWWDVGRERCRLGTWDLGGLPTNIQDDLIHELTMPKYEAVDSQGKIKIEPKDKIRERLGASPDLAEALLLAFVPASWAGTTENVSALMSAPSLLSAFSPADMLNSRGW